MKAIALRSLFINSIVVAFLFPHIAFGGAGYEDISQFKIVSSSNPFRFSAVLDPGPLYGVYLLDQDMWTIWQETPGVYSPYNSRQTGDQNTGFLGESPLYLNDGTYYFVPLSQLLVWEPGNIQYGYSQVQEITVSNGRINKVAYDTLTDFAGTVSDNFHICGGSGCSGEIFDKVYGYKRFNSVLSFNRAQFDLAVLGVQDSQTLRGFFTLTIYESDGSGEVETFVARSRPLDISSFTTDAMCGENFSCIKNFDFDAEVPIMPGVRYAFVFDGNIQGDIPSDVVVVRGAYENENEWGDAMRLFSDVGTTVLKDLRIVINNPSVYFSKGDGVAVPRTRVFTLDDGDISNTIDITPHPSTVNSNSLGTTWLQYNISNSQGAVAPTKTAAVTIVPNKTHIPLFGVPLSEDKELTEIISVLQSYNDNWSARRGFQFTPLQDISDIRNVGMYIYKTGNGRPFGSLHLYIYENSLPSNENSVLLSGSSLNSDEVPFDLSTERTQTYFNLSNTVHLSAGKTYYFILQRDVRLDSWAWYGSEYAFYRSIGTDLYENITEVSCLIYSPNCIGLGSDVPFTLFSALPSESSLPSLSFAVGEGYDDDRFGNNKGIHPDRGVADKDELTFKVVYTDQDNDTPAFLVSATNTTTGENFSYHTMELDTEATSSLRDGDYTNGEQFMLSKTFSKGRYEYSFNVSDGTSTTTLSEYDSEKLTFRTGYSNVAFLPGLEASRLYKPDYNGGTERLWEPELLHDNSQLNLNVGGFPDRSDIYTRDVIDNAYVPLKGNIYASFISSMNEMKDKKVINNWKALPYDWRLSLEELLDNGREFPDGRLYYSGELAATSSPYIIQELRRLALTSDTGKVTIVAHSNGGLLTKALTNKLGEEAPELLDQIIFVAVPQVGTPQAIGALLHGFDQGLPKDWLPLFISPEEARTLAKNMPSAYNLLPSAEYFTYVDDPVITFNDSTLLAPWREKYGTEIHSQERLDTFLNDLSREAMSVDEELKNPIVGNPFLFDKTKTLHEILDSWVPPEGVQLIEIAGWGEDTLKTIEYYQGLESGCSDPNDIWTCRPIPILEYKPVTTVDGDGTVLVPSALWTAESTGVEKYWVNLSDYNGFFSINRKHADILEMFELNTLIKNIVVRNGVIPQNYITTMAPAGKPNDIRLRFTLHSPLYLDIYDDQGNHTGFSTTTGELEENIPGSRYRTFGELKYISVPATTVTHVSMRGYTTGSFTLDVEKIQGDTIITSTSFAAIPSSTGTIATLDVLQGGEIENLSPLRVDVDGNGVLDIVLTPKVGEIVSPDFVPPETIAATSGTLGTNDWYTSSTTVTLVATDSGSGVKKTFYSLDEGITWNTYATSIIVSKEGETAILYYSIDNAENHEETHSLIVKIDTTAPQIRISIDSLTKDLKVEGVDISGTTVSKGTDNTYVITDTAGHTTKLFFKKTFSGKSLTYAKLTGVQYDTHNIITLPSSSFIYVWQPKTQTLLSQTIVVNSTYVLEAMYNQKKNVTTVLLKKKGVVMQKKEFTGLYIPKLTVDNGVVGYEW